MILRLFLLFCLSVSTTRVCGASWSNWHPQAWATIRGGTETAEAFAPVHTHVVTNWLNYANRVSTNIHVSPVYFQSNLTTSVLSVRYLLDTSTGGVVTNTVTTTNWFSPLSATLAYREVVGFDVFTAMRERDSVLGAGASTLESTGYFPPVYRNEREQLVAAKTWLKANCTNFVNTTVEPPVNNWTVTGLLARFDLPTNYFDQTPKSALWCGDTGAFMVVTSRIMVVGTSSPTTNILVNSCGDVFTNIGVMGTGTLVEVVCTNALPFQGTNRNASTWGWCPMPDLFNSLMVTRVQGRGQDAWVESVGSTLQTNVWIYPPGRGGPFCSMAEFETNIVFTPATNFPLYETRKYTISTNVTYQYEYRIDDIEGGEACDTPWVEGSPSSFSTCDFFLNVTNILSFSCVSNALTTTAYREVYRLTNTVTDLCTNDYLCPLPVMELRSHVSPIVFNISTSMYPTNITWVPDVWVRSGASGVSGYDAEFINPFVGVNLHTNGWTNNLWLGTNGWDTATNSVWVVTNFTPARVPWQGSAVTNPMAWAVYDAVLLRRWNFTRHPNP